MERRRGFSVFQDGTCTRSKQLRSVGVSRLSRITPNRAPLQFKNVNVSTLFCTSQVKRPRQKLNHAPLSSLHAPSCPSAGSEEAAESEHVSSILRASKIEHSAIPSRAVEKRALRRRMHDVPQGFVLVHQLLAALNEFYLLERTSQGTAEYDLLVNVKSAVWLSPSEVLVSTDNPKVGTVVLHNSEPVTMPVFERHEAPKRLAISSKCCLTLYNDINWYLKWKFL